MNSSEKKKGFVSFILRFEMFVFKRKKSNKNNEKKRSQLLCKMLKDDARIVHYCEWRWIKKVFVYLSMIMKMVQREYLRISFGPNRFPTIH